MIMIIVAGLLIFTGSGLFTVTLRKPGMQVRRKVSLQISGILCCTVGMLIFCRVWRVAPWIAFLVSWLILSVMMTGGVLMMERGRRAICKPVELSEPTVSHEETGEPMPSDGGELLQPHLRS